MGKSYLEEGKGASSPCLKTGDSGARKFVEAMEATKSIFLAKGKTNYLCLNRLNDAIRIDPKNEELILLENWVKNSQVNSECAGFGDKSWIPEVSEKVWNRICVKRYQESRCKLFFVCGYMSYRQQRRRASGIIVINHDLLIADLRIRKRNKMLWPTPGMYIIDEAHALETSAQRQLSCVIGYGKMSYVLEQVARRKETRELISLETIKKALESLDEFFKILKRNLDPSGESKIIHVIPETVEKARRMTAALKEPFEGVQIALAGYGESVKGEFIEEAAECMEEAIDALEIFCKDLPEYVFYLEGDSEFIVSPLNVGDYLREELWGSRAPIILVSGTLAARGKLDYTRDRLGLRNLKASKAVEQFVGFSPFDYKNRVRIYIPEHMPRPKYDEEEDLEFIVALTGEIERLVKITDGRALVLFTSYRRMNAVYEILSRRDLPGQLLCQGKNFPPYKLLEIFRNDINSILLATGTFWEGVDAAGETLTLVIMDKLPFPSPNDPLTYGRHERAKEQGRNVFQEVDIPEMLLRLKQGAGRLIRHEDDWGIIAIMDSRAANSYKELVQEALPPAPWAKSIEEIQTWYEAVSQSRRRK